MSVEEREKVKLKFPHKVTLQSAANARDTSVKGLQYLMEKEISTHDGCYTEYVRCLQEKPKDQNLFSSVDVTGDFDAFKKLINDNILHCNNAVSMVKLHNVYKTGVYNVNSRVYRSILKDRIKSEFGNQLLFLTINSTTP